MKYEIERKFLVKGDYKSHAFAHHRIMQGYLSSDSSLVVRIRIADEKAYLTIKSTVNGTEFTRYEWEYEIPLKDAEDMLKFCGKSVIEKTRYVVKVGESVFEVDEFHGDNEGLTIAEIELHSEGEPFEKPDWLGEEVTHDIRYYNAYLSKYPYSKWKMKSC